jgi:hypothetical protein
MRLDGQTIAEQVADQNPATKASPKSKLGHHRNSPQLTTNPEDSFYPQPTGWSSSIDFLSLSESQESKFKEKTLGRTRLLADHEAA